MIHTYNPEQMQLVLSYRSKDAITDFDTNTVNLTNWNSMTINYSEDRYEFTTSTTGQITRSKILNKLGTFEIVAPEGSDVCKWLSKLVNTNAKIFITATEKAFKQPDQLPPPLDLGNVVAEFILSDASISNAGTGSRARTSGERTWVLTGEISKFNESDYTD